jgi:outer membrane translocation and assembly module TamA
MLLYYHGTSEPISAQRASLESGSAIGYTLCGLDGKIHSLEHDGTNFLGGTDSVRGYRRLRTVGLLM